jgi:hypothetical protein
MPPRRRAAAPPPDPEPDPPALQEEHHDAEQVVLHLPIQQDSCEHFLQQEDMHMVLEYDPLLTEPTPYIPRNNFISELECLETVEDEHNCVKSVQLPPPVSEGNCTANTAHNTKCFWCIHAVGPRPFGMPIRYDGLTGTFTTFGTFCSLECAAAHNFSVHMGSDRAWEIHSWIQMLGRRFGYVEPVRPAPSRYLLSIFDGPMSIDEFRQTHLNHERTCVLNIPPMISAPSQLEVLNTSYMTTTIQRERVTKKTVPAPKTKKTLDAKMNLTVIPVST